MFSPTISQENGRLHAFYAYFSKPVLEKVQKAKQACRYRRL
ncbi:hypothetical protein BN2497_10247 [Janthinobacterium sp. CG23_2]|nr:hypothetical protein BN2497_10247 [Janthinobacterium sp. CG23_2]CUU31521.1 hypothetical protein BN3177_10247 [Janthinobacterium sp. CG23_2]